MMTDQDDAARSRISHMFHNMQGNARLWGSEMAAHMPSLTLLARNWSFGHVVELGVGQGYSTCAFLCGLAGTGRRLISYDQNPLVTASLFKIMNVSGPSELNWEFRVSKSVEAAKDFEDGSVSLLFIDTDHRYEPTVQELEVWSPKIHPKGMIIGHDYFLEKMGDIVCGVRQAVDEFAYMNRERYHLQVLPHDEGLFILWPN